MVAGADPGLFTHCQPFGASVMAVVGHSESFPIPHSIGKRVSVTRISLRIHHNCGLHCHLSMGYSNLCNAIPVMPCLSKCRALSPCPRNHQSGGDRLALQVDIAKLQRQSRHTARLLSLPISRRGSRPSCSASVFHAKRIYW